MLHQYETQGMRLRFGAPSSTSEIMDKKRFQGVAEQRFLKKHQGLAEGWRILIDAAECIHNTYQERI